jgi:hypothetical protein
MAEFPAKAKLFETVRLNFVLQQLLKIVSCDCRVTFDSIQRYFRLNYSFQFHETDFMQPVSSMYDLLKTPKTSVE